MGNADDDEARPDRGAGTAPEKEPPYQALFPNLDRVTRSSFRKGTVSRRRIDRALLVLGLIVVAAAVAALVVPQFAR